MQAYSAGISGAGQGVRRNFILLGSKKKVCCQDKASYRGFGHTHTTLQQHEDGDLKIFDIYSKLKARETKAKKKVA